MLPQSHFKKNKIQTFKMKALFGLLIVRTGCGSSRGGGRGTGPPDRGRWSQSAGAGVLVCV